MKTTRTTFFLLSLLVLASLPCFGLNYTITFTGSGASATVGDVFVQNITRSTSVTVPAGNVLNLSDEVTAVGQLSATDGTIHVYSNSLEAKSTVSFYAKQPGVTQINAFGIDGRKIAGIKATLQEGMNSFQLSLPKGAYAIQVSGNGYTYSAKMINQSTSPSKPEITYIGTVKPASSNPQSSALDTTTMTYATGDQLLYKGTSGIYSTIVTDVPGGSKTTNFGFVACTDADGNNYTVVTIGTQTWMAENLKTTKYNDGPIPLVTDNTAWANSTPAYCWYGNNATYKNTYGALYNWYAVSTAKLAPTGWHVSTDAEWTTLENYAANLGTSGSATKALAATINWIASTSAGAIGNDLSKNNSSGFSALPGGNRGGDGTFSNVDTYGYWWSSTEGDTGHAWSRGLYYYSSYVNRYNYSKQNGLSVRCVKN